MQDLTLDIPEPKYPVGITAIALVNHQPRYINILAAHLNAQIILDEYGVHLEGALRWEYQVRVIADPIEASDYMIISERTIIMIVDPDEDEESA